jgi:hypothetical protein
MQEPLTISFADSEHGIQGFGIVGVGTLLRLGEELRLVGPPQFAWNAESWRVSADDGFELSLAAWAGAAPLGDEHSDAVPARVSGTVGSWPVEGLALLRGAGGSSGDAGSGAAAGRDVAVDRMLAALFDDGPLAVVLTAERPEGAAGHGEERLDALAFRGDPIDVVRIARPRLSRTYDSSGLLTHAGLELWESEESDRPLRIGGEALARGELAHADGLHSHVTFLAWHHEGLRGLGSYSIVLPA